VLVWARRRNRRGGGKESMGSYVVRGAWKIAVRGEEKVINLT